MSNQSHNYPRQAMLALNPHYRYTQKPLPSQPHHQLIILKLCNDTT